MSIAPMLYTIVLTLWVLKTVAFWRRVISLMRGCCQLPGLSVTGPGVDLEGVKKAPEEVRDLLNERAVVDDMAAGRYLLEVVAVDGS